MCTMHLQVINLIMVLTFLAVWGVVGRILVRQH
jgi:hypothetical protein